MSNSAIPGLPSYRGYEFQKLVTVWLALKLMCDEQKCDELVVEPASEEDVAAELKVDNATAIIGANAGSVPIEIQIKSRNKNWSATAFGDIVTARPAAGSAKRKARGPLPRQRALDLLASAPAQLFLLITNAQLDADLADLKVSGIGDKSRSAGLHFRGGNKVQKDVVSRLSILPDMTSERVELEIDGLLKKCGHVPQSKLAACRANMIDEVHRRLLGKSPGAWSKVNLLDLMRAAGGMPLTAVNIVPPANFPQLRQQLENQYCIVLTGGPGVGKTETARELVRLHRLRDEPFERIDGLQAGAGGVIAALETPGAHIFVFEDPWGSDRLHENAAFWAKELPALMRRASAENRFVVTSREAIRQEALGAFMSVGLANIEAKLTPAHYPENLRLQIVAQRMADAAPWQKDWLIRHRDRCLRELTVPLSLDHLCSRVKRAASADELEIDDLLRECAVDVLAQTCMHEVRARRAAGIGAAIAFWALLQARQRIGRETPAEVVHFLAQGGYKAPVDAEKTFAWLVKAGWLRPDGDGFAAHATTLAGIEQFLTEVPDDAHKILHALLIGLTGNELVSEAFLILRHLAQRPGVIRGTVRTKIERHLVEEFLKASSGVARDAMSNIVTYSTAKDAVTQLLKALDAREPVSKMMPGFERWRSSTVSQPVRQTIRTSEEAYQAARIFVMYALPDTAAMRYRAADLVAFFLDFGWDFGLEFQALCHAGFEDIRTSPNLDLLLECACRSKRPQFATMLDRCFEGVAAAEKLLDTNDGKRRAISQSEVNADSSSHEDEEMQEILALRYVILRDLVKYRRRAEGWRWIPSEPRRDELLESWAEVLDVSTTDEELAGLIAAAGTGHRPVVWKAVANSGKMHLLAEILNDLPAAPLEEFRQAAEQLIKFVPVERWPEVVTRVRSLPFVRRAALVAADIYHGDVEEALRDALLDAFTPAEHIALTLCRSADPNELAMTYDTSVRAALLELAANAAEELAARATFILARGGESVASQVGRLRPSGDRRTRQWAVLAGIMGSPPVLGPSDLLGVLGDAEYRIARLAMQGLAPASDATARTAILSMHEHRSAPLREACVELIGRHRWPEGVPILLKLLRDRRDRNPIGYFVDSRPDLHVARAAAKSLGKFESLDTNAITSCLEFLRRPSPAARKKIREDVEVHRDVLGALVSHDDPRIVPAFCALLDDDWFVVGNEHSGFPRRYAAAWSLFNHLHQHPGNSSQLDVDALITAARHDDGRLAAPCLAILAANSDVAPEPLLRACASANPSRLALVLDWTPDDAQEAEAGVRKLLGDHPALEFIDATDRPTTAAQWDVWCAAHLRFASWLDSIASTDDVNSALRWSLSLAFGDEPPSKFSSEDLQASLTPKSIGSVTTWSMFNE